MKLKDYSEAWEDTEAFHDLTNLNFEDFVNSDEKLKEHRTWVKENFFGFGEDSFHWLHKLIVDEMPKDFSFMEIGVFRGQILSLYKLLANIQGKNVKRYGVTPLDNSGGVWDSDYAKDLQTIHNKFKLDKDFVIYKGSSVNPEIIQQATKNQVNVLFIDGSHEYEDVVSDLKHYVSLVKSGGFLVIDDACNDMKQPFGFFQGINSVTDAVLEWEKSQSDFEFIFNVVHNRVYKRK
jgi:hypothetical protein